MITTLHVLTVGSADAAGLVRDALASLTRCRLYVATCAWDLCVVLASEMIDVAVLHDTFPADDLRVLEAYIRRHWPGARILLIHEKSKNLGHRMYGKRIDQGLSAEMLLAAIERPAASVQRRTRRSVVQPKSAKRGYQRGLSKDLIRVQPC